MLQLYIVWVEVVEKVHSFTSHATANIAGQNRKNRIWLENSSENKKIPKIEQCVDVK